MVLTKSELNDSLKKEVRILLHLMGKLDRAHLDYRPGPKQRSAIEVVRYLSFMGPTLIQAAKSGFDMAKWRAAVQAAEKQGFDELLSTIEAQPGVYDGLLADMSDSDFRGEMTGFDGKKITRGAFIVNLVLAGSAAYRTQLFLYLKACGRVELGTMNLWQGVDPPSPSA